jgi:hypothetical protein
MSTTRDTLANLFAPLDDAGIRTPPCSVPRMKDPKTHTFDEEGGVIVSAEVVYRHATLHVYGDPLVIDRQQILETEGSKNIETLVIDSIRFVITDATTLNTTDHIVEMPYVRSVVRSKGGLNGASFDRLEPVTVPPRNDRNCTQCFLTDELDAFREAIENVIVWKRGVILILGNRPSKRRRVIE